MTLWRAALVASACALGVSCLPATTSATCQNNSSCPAGYRCDGQSHLCTLQERSDAAPTDASGHDAGRDGSVPDAAHPDATRPDLALPDATLPDHSAPDRWQPDLWLPDTALPDACLAHDTDCDGDPDATDCGPNDARRNHSATEDCNGLDDDCDGTVDEGLSTSDCGAPLYLNDLYLTAFVDYPSPQQAQFYQDTIVVASQPAIGWDGGQHDLALLEGFVDFGTGFTRQDDLRGRAPVLETAPDGNLFEYVGAFTMAADGSTLQQVYRLRSARVQVLNAPFIGDTGITTGPESEWLQRTAYARKRPNYRLRLGANRFTVLSPEAVEIGTTGTVGLFISQANDGLVFGVAAPPTLAALDSSSSGGSTGDAVNRYLPTHPGGDQTCMRAPGYWSPSSTLSVTLASIYSVTITYFNVAGDFSSALPDAGNLVDGLTSTGGPGVVGITASTYDWIDNNVGDAICYLEVTVQRLPTPVPTAVP